MLSCITSGKYAESLSDETARAFGRLWTGKADEGVLKENGSGQKTLMELSDEDLAEKAERIRGRFKRGNKGIESFKYLSAEDQDLLTRDALQNHEYRTISEGVYVAEENFGENGKNEDVLNREIDNAVLMHQLGIANEIYIVPEG